MAFIGTKGILRNSMDAGGRHYVGFFCPGCQSVHVVGVDGGGAPGQNWQWNGDPDKPVLSPSVRIFSPAHERDGVSHPERTLCHCFVGSSGAQPGEIIFLDDSSAHKLRGVYPLPPWPHYYGGMET